MILELSFLFYFFCLVLFSLVSHPVYYCGLLILRSVICAFICYIIFGFSWYALLFCLVYVGGVYILFVFVSIHSPNNSIVTYWKFGFVSSSMLLLFCSRWRFFIYYSALDSEFSRFLCNISEGFMYLSLCLILLFGFIVLSLVMRIKINHYR